MATSVGTLSARVTADISGLQMGLNRATAQIRNFTTKSQGYLKANAAQIGQLGRKFMMAGAAINAGLIVGVKMFGDFDRAMRKATAVSDVTEKQFTKMSKMAETMSKKLGVSANSTAEAFYFLGSAGLKASEQIAAFSSVAILAKAAVIDMGSAAEMVVDTMKGFKIPFTDTARVTDVLTEAVTSSNMTFAQLGEALSYVSGLAKSTNNSLEETTAVIGIMADVGIKGTRAGTSLRRALLNLAAPTNEVNEALDTLGKDGSSADKAKESMENLGVQIYDSSGKMRSMTEIMGDLIPALNGVSEQTRNMALKQLFGARAVTGMIAVVGKGAEGLKEFTKQLKNSGGAAENVAKKQLAALNEKFKVLGQHIADISRDIGEVLAPTVTKLISKIQALVDRFGDLSPGIKKVVVLFIALVGGLSILGGAIMAVAAGVAIFGGGMLALGGWIALAVVAIGVLVTAFVALHKNWGHITDRIAYYVNFLWSEIKEKFGKIGVIVRETMKRVANPLNIRAWKNLKKDIKKETDEITKNAKKFRKNLTEIYVSTVFAPKPLGEGKPTAKPTKEPVAGGGGTSSPKMDDAGLAAWKDAYQKAILSEYKYEIYLLEKRKDAFEEEGRNEVKIKKWFAIEKGKIDEEYIEKGREIAEAKEDEDIKRLLGIIEVEETGAKKIAQVTREIALSNIKNKYEREKELAELNAKDDIDNSGLVEDQKAEYIKKRNELLAIELAEIDEKADEETLKKSQELAEKLADAYKEGVLKQEGITKEQQIRLLEQYRDTFLVQFPAIYEEMTATIGGLQDSMAVTLQEKWAETLDVLQGRFGEMGEYLKNWVSSFADNFSSGLADLMGGVKNFGDFWKGIWEGIKKMTFKLIAGMMVKWLMLHVFQKMLAVKTAAGGVAGQVAIAISKSFAAYADIPFIGLALGAAAAGAQVAAITGATAPILASIPALGEGGIISKPTLVLAGEKGPEKITPLGKTENPINVNFTVYGGINTEVDYEILKKDLTGTIKDAIRGD